MEQRPNRTATIAVVTGLIALFFGLCAGVALGGIGGYLLGRGNAAGAAGVTGERAVPFGPLGPLTPLPGSSGAVVVQSVVPGSPADTAGIAAGDIIVRVDDSPLDGSTRLTDIIARLRPGDRVKLTLQRFGMERSVDVTLGQFPGDAQRAYLGIRYSQAAGEPAATPTP